ncbi:GNAT family N-acetyltransferase [Arenibacterium halophilum]|uniref:L-ornithine N(alpha)-acyltransferase n=1 Tax=Arenibacterium halophilum TaxID=2583821 RepID=A0ABY2XAR3_9RHOB|nr:GNAT family N-acyltransferase [Arenibacterium halophilum]TMV13456.1 GNAT family N-acetyltransferase [Arenibacterium halophilum]
MTSSQAHFSVRLAQTSEDLRAAQALRYDVFVRELGAGGEMVDHVEGLERDRFDDHVDHMLLIDDAVGRVVGVYRLLQQQQAEALGGFYSEGEYDLTPLKNSGRRLLELGRSCLARDYRGGIGMHHMWQGLADYVHEREIDVLFGTASFHGTDAQALAEPLTMLHLNHLAPPELRVRALEKHYQPMNLVAPDQLDRRRAMVAVPALIKAYLRLGGTVGDGAYVDHTFNTTDVCLILDTARMNDRSRRSLTGGAG